MLVIKIIVSPSKLRTCWNPDSKKSSPLAYENGYIPKIDKGFIHHLAIPKSVTEFDRISISKVSHPIA